MKNTLLFFLSLLFFCFLVTCKRTDGGANQPIFCTDIYRLPLVHVKFLDKSSGNNLIYGPGSKFALNQIQIISNQTHLGSIPDSLNKTLDLIGASQGADTIKVTLPGYSTDTFIIITASDGQPCPQPIVSQVYLNGFSLCKPCDTFTATILK